jgi:enoyl-CoA hydratase
MADIEFSVRQNGLARVLLNRPEALNALTHEMCVALDAKLQEWAGADEVKAVLVEGAGGRAFCAGGDIRKLYDEGKAGGDYPYAFYRDEYRCNARIKHWPKPYIAVLDGIVMGGGVGVSVHGSHRIATEQTMFAMPETGIGLFPDVGGSYFLPRCPGEIGMFLALTGERLKAADCVYAGIATHFVPRRNLPELAAALAAADLGITGAADQVIAAFAADPGPAPLAERRAIIDGCFKSLSVEGIVSCLDAGNDPWVQALAETIRSKSPTSLKLTYRQIREGAKLDFDSCMRMEWRIVNRIIKGHDFYEGTRAQVIDKDRRPRWRPASLEAVDQAEVAAYFMPPPKGELALE